MTALPMVVAAQLLAAAVLTLTLVWVLHFRGGVSWNRPSDAVLVYTVESMHCIGACAPYILEQENVIYMRSPFLRHTLCSW